MFEKRGRGIPPVREIFLWPKESTTRNRLKKMGYESFRMKVPFGNYRLSTTVFLCPNRHIARSLQKNPRFKFRTLTCFKSFRGHERIHRSPLKYYRALHVGIRVRDSEEISVFAKNGEPSQ